MHVRWLLAWTWLMIVWGPSPRAQTERCCTCTPALHTLPCMSCCQSLTPPVIQSSDPQVWVDSGCHAGLASGRSVARGTILGNSVSLEREAVWGGRPSLESVWSVSNVDHSNEFWQSQIWNSLQALRRFSLTKFFSLRIMRRRIQQFSPLKICLFSLTSVFVTTFSHQLVLGKCPDDIFSVLFCKCVMTHWNQFQSMNHQCETNWEKHNAGQQKGLLGCDSQKTTFCNLNSKITPSCVISVRPLKPVTMHHFTGHHKQEVSNWHLAWVTTTTETAKNIEPFNLIFLCWPFLWENTVQTNLVQSPARPNFRWWLRKSVLLDAQVVSSSTKRDSCCECCHWWFHVTSQDPHLFCHPCLWSNPHF